MTKTYRRVARVRHFCTSCDQPIEPGTVYLVHVLFPGNDIYPDITAPMRGRECPACATRYGRGAAVA